MKTQIIQTLTAEQHREYALLKAEIQQHVYEGLKHFELAGLKMRRVRDARLYIEEHNTFADFVRAELRKSGRFADYLINACGVMEGLRAEGVSKLPDSERICRELAKFPTIDRAFILKRAQAIAKRRDPTYLTIREAATTLDKVPRKEVQQVWIGEMLERIKSAKRALAVGVRFQRRD